MSKQIVLVKWFRTNNSIENYINEKISEGYTVERIDISHTNTFMNGHQYLLSLTLREAEEK